MQTDSGSPTSTEVRPVPGEINTKSNTEFGETNTKQRKPPKGLTDASLRSKVEKLRQQGGGVIRDAGTSGLELRVGPNSCTWSIPIRVKGEGGVSKRGFKRKGKRHRPTLGEYPALSLAGVRTLANSYIEQANNGINPVKALETKATVGGLTVEQIATKFIDDYVKMKELRALAKYQGAIDVHLVPNLGSTLADLVTRDEARELLKKVMVKTPRGNGARDRSRGGKEAARTVLGVFRKMLNWAIAEELLTRKDNPCEGLEANLPKKRRGERVLSEEEMQLAWVAAGTLGYPFGPVYRLLQLTANREGNWAEAIKDWIDLTAALAVIPAQSFKSDHVHVVPLVPAAVQMMDEVYRTFPRSRGPYIFSGTDGEKPISGWSKAQERLMRAMCAVSGEKAVKDFNPHDIRRTVATMVAEQLGIGGEQLIKRVLGHGDGSVTAIYNRYGYVREMRAALEELARKVMRWEPVELVSRPYIRAEEDRPVPAWAVNHASGLLVKNGNR